MSVDCIAVLIRELEVRERELNTRLENLREERAKAEEIGGELNTENYIPIIDRKIADAVARRTEVQVVLNEARNGKISVKTG